MIRNFILITLFIFGSISSFGDTCKSSLPNCATDINESGNVDIIDLLAVVSALGSTEQNGERPAGDCAPFPNGDCIVNTFDLLAVVSGLGDTCEIIDPLGTCCLGGTSCLDATKVECAQQLGLWYGDGTNCSDQPCTFGTCCLPSGECTWKTLNDCSNQGGFYQSSAASCIDITCPAKTPNDECDGSLIITDPGNYSFDTRGASTSNDVDSSCLGGAYKDIWFEWTATADGEAVFSICDSTDFDAVIAVWTGNSCLKKKLVQCNQSSDNCSDGSSEITLEEVLEGTTFFIQVSGLNDEEDAGVGSLQFDFTGSDGSSSGACCVNAFFCLDNFSASECDNLNGSFRGPDSSCDLINCGEPAPGACCISEGICELLSSQNCTSEGGVFFGDASSCDSLVCYDPVINDLCSSAIDIAPGINPFTTLGTTAGDNVPFNPGICTDNQAGTVVHDIWFKYTPITSGIATLSLCGNVDYDSTIAIYRSNSNNCNSLQLIGCAGDTQGCRRSNGAEQVASSISGSFLAGTNYFIRIGGKENSPYGDWGTGELLFLNSQTTGACCLDNGQCIDDLNENECENNNGTHFLTAACSETACQSDGTCFASDCVGYDNGIQNSNGAYRALFGWADLAGLVSDQGTAFLISTGSKDASFNEFGGEFLLVNGPPPLALRLSFFSSTQNPLPNDIIAYHDELITIEDGLIIEPTGETGYQGYPVYAVSAPINANLQNGDYIVHLTFPGASVNWYHAISNGCAPSFVYFGLGRAPLLDNETFSFYLCE